MARGAGATIPAIYLRQVAAQVGALGVDVAAWLARAGVRAAEIDDPSVDLSFDTFRRLIEDALVVTREPALGLFVGQRVQVQMHGVPGYAASSSGSIRQALGVFESFTHLRFPLLRVSASESRPPRPGPVEVRVRFEETRPLGAVGASVAEAAVMATKNILDAITMGECRIRRVAFSFEEPPYAELARELFGCDVEWGASWAGFALPREVLDRPLRASDPLAFREAVEICARELEHVRDDPTLSGRVRRLLLEQQNGFPSLEIAARLLHMTPRTLHRRLVEEGSSFRQELEHVRHRLAVEHLKAGRFGLQEIAFTLGYSDFANFRRAFRRWEGMPPSAYRARHQRRPTT